MDVVFVLCPPAFAPAEKRPTRSQHRTAPRRARSKPSGETAILSRFKLLTNDKNVQRREVVLNLMGGSRGGMRPLLLASAIPFNQDTLHIYLNGTLRSNSTTSISRERHQIRKLRTSNKPLFPSLDRYRRGLSRPQLVHTSNKKALRTRYTPTPPSPPPQKTKTPQRQITKICCNAAVRRLFV